MQSPVQVLVKCDTDLAVCQVPRVRWWAGQVKPCGAEHVGSSSALWRQAPALFSALRLLQLTWWADGSRVGSLIFTLQVPTLRVWWFLRAQLIGPGVAEDSLQDWALTSGRRVPTACFRDWNVSRWEFSEGIRCLLLTGPWREDGGESWVKGCSWCRFWPSGGTFLKLLRHSDLRNWYFYRGKKRLLIVHTHAFSCDFLLWCCCRHCSLDQNCLWFLVLPGKFLGLSRIHVGL